MQVDAFLADSVVTAEGKLFVQGAGWDNINAPGFPYAHDQWISAAGTSWAVMALSLTVDPQRIVQTRPAG